MATLLNPSIIAKETLMQLTNSMVMTRHVHTAYKNEFVKVGATIQIRKPNKFRENIGTDLTSALTTISESSTSITVATQSNVGWKFSSQELTLTIENYSKRYIEPGALALANGRDAALCGLYKGVYNSVGTPGVTPATFAALGAAQRRLDDEAVPSDARVGILNPAANWALADGLKGTFAQNVAKDIITKGFLGQIANLSLYTDQNVVRHTCGHFTTGSTPVMDGTTSTGVDHIHTLGWGATGTVLTGDVFTIAGVYAVNPMSGVSTGVLRQFVATADAEDDGAAGMIIYVSPSIIYTSTNPYSTVNALPLTGAAITFMGTQDISYAQNLIYHPNAFAFVTVPLEMPSGVWGARETDPEAGLSVIVVKQFDVLTYYEIIRVDILSGVKVLYPELACRIWGE